MRVLILNGQMSVDGTKIAVRTYGNHPYSISSTIQNLAGETVLFLGTINIPEAEPESTSWDARGTNLDGKPAYNFVIDVPTPLG